MVSIIIPTYNRAALPVEAIDSVLHQSYQDFEIIIIDDGFGDDTSEKIAAYNSGKIRYYKQENAGAGHARNHGLELGEGKYVAFLDSDDMWLDFKLELEISIMDRFSDIAFLCSDSFILKQDNRIIPNGLTTWFAKPLVLDNVYENTYAFRSLGILLENFSRDFTRYTGNIYRALLHFPYILLSTSIVRASTLSPYTKFDEDIPMYEDWVFFARLAHGHMSAYLAIETTINRGHTDPGRLTQADILTKTKCRLKLVDYVWSMDDLFL